MVGVNSHNFDYFSFHLNQHINHGNKFAVSSSFPFPYKIQRKFALPAQRVACWHCPCFSFFFFKDLTNFVTFLLYFFPPKQLCVIFSPVDKKMLPVFTFISWGPPHVLILFLLLFLRSGCFIWFDGDLCVLEFWCDLNFQWDGCQSQIRTM